MVNKGYGLRLPRGRSLLATAAQLEMVNRREMWLDDATFRSEGTDNRNALV